MRSLCTNASSRFKFPSISFSGAGFLGIYHTGVYACLLKHGYVLKPFERIDNDTKAPILTGVSAGSLIAAAISAGVHPDDSMNVVNTVAARTRTKGGVLDAMMPGFSLVDQVEDLILAEMRKALGGSSESPDDYDNDLLMNRIRKGQLLHIGLTDRRKMNIIPLQQDLNSYVYVNQYRNIDDIVSASILSSYIPVGTGPLNAVLDTKNLTVSRAFKGIQEMEKLGFLKHARTGTTVQVARTEKDDEAYQDDSQQSVYYLDGGLSNMFPEIDESTLVVLPVNGRHSHPFIAPALPYDQDDTDAPLFHKILEKTNASQVYIQNRIKIGVNSDNVKSFSMMLRSSSPEALDEKFHEGYDDAHRFLKENGLLRIFTA